MSVEHSAEALQLRVIEVAGDGLARVLDNVGTGVEDVLAALNHAETRAWSMASGLSLPKCGIRRLRR